MDYFLLPVSFFIQSGRDQSQEPTAAQLSRGKEEPSFPAVGVGSVKPVHSLCPLVGKALDGGH